MGEGGDILDAGLLEGVEDFHDDAEGGFAVGLQGDAALGLGEKDLKLMLRLVSAQNRLAMTG